MKVYIILLYISSFVSSWKKPNLAFRILPFKSFERSTLILSASNPSLYAKSKDRTKIAKYSPEKRLFRSSSSDDNESISSEIDNIEDLLNEVKRNSFDITWNMLAGIHSSNVLNKGNCNMLLKHLGDNGKLDKCELVYNFMQSNNIKRTIITYNTIIARAGQWKCISIAEKYFRLLKESQLLVPDEQVFNSMINAYSKAEMIDDAFKTYQEMIAINIKPSVVTFNTLIDACSRSGSIERAQDILSTMKSNNVNPNIRTYSSLVQVWCTAGNISAAIKVLSQMESENMQPSSVTYSIILDALGRAGRIDDAFTLIQKLKSKNISVNVVTLSSIVYACTKSGRLDDAFLLYHEMLHSNNDNNRPNSITYSSLIDACLKAGEVDQAFSVLNDMRKRKIQLTTVTYTSLITELTKLKRLDKILEFTAQEPKDFEWMSDVKSNPASYSFPNTAMSLKSSHQADSSSSKHLKGDIDYMKLKSFSEKLLNQVYLIDMELSKLSNLLKDKDLVLSSINISAFSMLAESLLHNMPAVKETYELLQLQNESISESAYNLDQNHIKLLLPMFQTIIDSEENAKRLIDVETVLHSQLSPSSTYDDPIERYDDIDKRHLKQSVIDSISIILKPAEYSNDALNQYETLKTNGELPDAVTCINIVQSLYESSVKKTTFSPSKFRAQMRSNDLFRLYLVFQEMRHNPNIKVDAPVYNTLIDACAEAGDVARALETLQSMREDGIEPTPITYTSLIKACHMRGGAEMIVLAEDLLAEMQQKSNHFSNYLAPTRITFQTLIQVHFTVRPNDVNTTRIWMLADDMASRGFKPSLKTYRSYVRAAVIDNDVSKALATISAMRKLKPPCFDFQSWGMVANLCRRINIPELAAELKDEIYLKKLKLEDTMHSIYEC